MMRLTVEEAMTKAVWLRRSSLPVDLGVKKEKGWMQVAINAALFDVNRTKRARSSDVGSEVSTSIACALISANAVSCP